MLFHNKINFNLLPEYLIDVPPSCPIYVLAEIEVTRFGDGDGYALVG